MANKLWFNIQPEAPNHGPPLEGESPPRQAESGQILAFTTGPDGRLVALKPLDQSNQQGHENDPEASDSEQIKPAPNEGTDPLGNSSSGNHSFVQSGSIFDSDAIPTAAGPILPNGDVALSSGSSLLLFDANDRLEALSSTEIDSLLFEERGAGITNFAVPAFTRASNADLLATAASESNPVLPDPGLPALFGTDANTVDFNAVDAGSYQDGTQYDAGNGADLVSLPSNATQAAEAGFDTTQTFNGGDGTDTIVGRNLNDKIAGDAGDDDLTGAFGNDTLDGGSGNDILSGGRGADKLIGGIDDDNLDGGSGNDTLLGGAGDDTLYGGATWGSGKATEIGGDDVLLGGAGNDILDGGVGDDDLSGGADDDTLTGGAGADNFKMSLSFDGSLLSGEGADMITDFTTQDTLVFEDVVDIDTSGGVDIDDLLGHVSVTDAGAGNDVMIAFDGGGSVALAGIGTGSLNSLQDILDAGFDIDVTG